MTSDCCLRFMANIRSIICNSIVFFVISTIFALQLSIIIIAYEDILLCSKVCLVSPIVFVISLLFILILLTLTTIKKCANSSHLLTCMTACVVISSHILSIITYPIYINSSCDVNNSSNGNRSFKILLSAEFAVCIVFFSCMLFQCALECNTKLAEIENQVRIKNENEVSITIE